MKHNRNINYLIVSLFFLVLCSFPVRGYAQGINAFTSPEEGSDLARTAFSFNYQFFSGKEMKDSYTDGLYGFHLQRYSWEWDQIGIVYGGGIIGGEGSGKVLDPSWTVVTNDLGFWAIDLEGTIIARLPGERPFNSVTPFIGLGLDAFGATEKLSVTIMKDTVSGSEHFPKTVRGDASALRATLAGHLLLGILIPVGKGNDLEIDVKALFSAAGGFHDLITSDQESTLERDIYSVIKRPSFNLTGISIRLGLTI